MSHARSTDRALIAALAMLLGACAPAVDDEEFKLATKLCESHGGLRWVWTHSKSAQCRNGVDVEYRFYKP